MFPQWASSPAWANFSSAAPFATGSSFLCSSLTATPGSPESLCGAFLLQWKENLTLTETQVQALALNRQAGQELDVKRREAIYNDVLTKQQMVRKTPQSWWFVQGGQKWLLWMDLVVSLPPQVVPQLIWKHPSNVWMAELRGKISSLAECPGCETIHFPFQAAGNHVLKQMLKGGYWNHWRWPPFPSPLVNWGQGSLKYDGFLATSPSLGLRERMVLCLGQD